MSDVYIFVQFISLKTVTCKIFRSPKSCKIFRSPKSLMSEIFVFYVLQSRNRTWKPHPTI